MKQQIIAYYLDFKNSNMKLAQYAKQKNLTANELESILQCGRALIAPNKWLSDKQLIEDTLSSKNTTIVDLCKTIGVYHAEINEVIKLKRGLSKKVKYLIYQHYLEM